MKYLYYLISLLMITGCQSKKGSQDKGFANKADQVGAEIVDNSELLSFFDHPRKALTPYFGFLPAGSNQPGGWILALMENDLENGMVGALDELYPAFGKDDIYDKDRRGGMEDIPEMGDIMLTGAEWEKSIMWWNAETIGNWRDGFVRHAFLTNNQPAMLQSRKMVEKLLASQDQDGYIGIYKENLRYQHEGSNGELWSQTTAFRMLLAYYEFTGEQKVLDAVERAMSLTMEKYGKEGRNPFYVKSAYGGVTHGLMMTDVCETLYRITGKEDYRDYASYLYRGFSTYSINRGFNDVRYPFLIKKDSLFEGHGAHTYEHLRSLLNAYYNTGYPELRTAFENAMHKLDLCILPSGAGHASEWIAKLKADPDHTAAEFCAMLELRNFFGSALQKTGNTDYADRAEKLTFNAMMGARSRDGTALTYCKEDNCHILDGKDHSYDPPIADPRYKYSPVHSDPAVCCVPNYTRNYSYYLDQMWMKADDGLAAVMYGPSLLSTTINGAALSIRQSTHYPLSDQILFEIEIQEPSSFALYFRKPGWVKGMEIIAGDVVPSFEKGYYRLAKEWKKGDKVQLQFVHEVTAREFRNGERYFQRGPIVFALPIEHREKTIKTYDLEGFTDYYCIPVEEKFKELYWSEDEQAEPEFVVRAFDADQNPWYRPEPYIIANMKDREGDSEKVKLGPMGNTVLRQVTFPIK